MRKRGWKIAAGLTAVAIITAACGGSSEPEEVTEATAPVEEMAPEVELATTDTGAAELRAGLTALLEEHVYLAGIAVNTAVGGGDFDAAAGVLDENSVALSEAIASVYGEDAGDAFLELWRTHIGFFVDYTNAKAEGDDDAAQAARDALDGYRTDFGAFLASANPNVTADGVAEELVPHVDSLFDAIDAAVAGDSSVFEKLRIAAGHMPGTANVLASAIVMQFPEMFG